MSFDDEQTWQPTGHSNEQPTWQAPPARGLSSSRNVIPERRLPHVVGRYRVERELGRGGMGVVYAGRDPQLERAVAIKLLLAMRDLDAETLARFRREGHAAARLTHPSIVRLYDVGEDEGRPFIVMELVEGRTLRAAFGQQLNRRAALAAIADVADALAYAHESGVVHRDVKPENIILRSDGSPTQLMDFGLALDQAAGERLTQAGTILGTPAYMSPEQTYGQAEAPADAYALGAILYEACAGAPPFSAPSIANLLTLIVNRHPPPLPTPVEPELEDLIFSCLRKNPLERPAVAEVASSLRRILVTPATPPPRVSPLAGAVLVGLLLGAVALGAFVYAAQSNNSASPPPEVPAPAVATTPVAPPEREPEPVPEPDPDPVPAPVREPVKRVWKLELDGEGVKPGSEDGIRLTGLRGFGVSANKLWLVVQGGGAIRAEFDVDHIPAWSELKLEYLSTNHQGDHFTPVEIQINGQVLVSRHAPRRGESLDVVRLIRPGLNELTIDVERDARTVLWLKHLEVTYGDGPREEKPAPGK